MVLAVSGGGSRAITEVLQRPGASRTVLEAIVPYSEAAMIAYLGGRLDQFCSPQTARAMAVAAWHRALRYETSAGRVNQGGQSHFRPPPLRVAGAKIGTVPSVPLAGVACTAGLATDRPRHGPHHAHVAVQTAARTATWSLELEKGRRSRADEEDLVARLMLNALAEACGVPQSPTRLTDSLRRSASLAKPQASNGPSSRNMVEDALDLDLSPGEKVQYTETLARGRGKS